MRPPVQAFREALKVTATGTVTVLLSTVTSCAFAIVIETGAHRLQYKLFPHWYDGKVKHAMGLPHLEHQQLYDENEKMSNTNMPVESYRNHLKTCNLQLKNTTVCNDEEAALAEDSSQSKFQNYEEKKHIDILSPDSMSKILLTTAMTG